MKFKNPKDIHNTSPIFLGGEDSTDHILSSTVLEHTELQCSVTNVLIGVRCQKTGT